LKIVRRDEAGQVVDSVGCFCHPEYEDFETVQAMSTLELVQFAMAKLKSDAMETSLTKARAGGIAIAFVLSNAEPPGRRRV
jgi:hypothetical protein